MKHLQSETLWEQSLWTQNKGAGFRKNDEQKTGEHVGKSKPTVIISFKCLHYGVHIWHIGRRGIIRATAF